MNKIITGIGALVITASTWQIAKLKYKSDVVICRSEIKDQKAETLTTTNNQQNAKIQTKQRQEKFIHNSPVADSAYDDEWLRLYTKKRDEYQASTNE